MTIFKRNANKSGYRLFVIKTDILIDNQVVAIGSASNDDEDNIKANFEVFLAHNTEKCWELKEYDRIDFKDLPEKIQKYMSEPFFEIDVRRYFSNNKYGFYV